MNRFDGRHSDTVTRAVNAARRARDAKCTCFKPYENGPCAACEAGVDAEEAFRDDPPDDAEEEAMERMEVSYESWLDRIGGST